MIELFGSISSILGFAIQLNDKTRQKPGNSEMALGGLLALSESSKSWKSLHSIYHPLEQNFDGIVSELSEYKNSRFIPKSPDYIIPASLRELFFDGTINTIIHTFSSRTRKDMKDISISLNIMTKM